MHWHLALWQKITGGLLKASRYKKEIIDLQDKKIAILKEENAILAREKSELKAKTANLEKELGGLRPKTSRLEEIQEEFLQLLAKHEPMTVRQIANGFDLPQVVAQRHADALLGKGMIEKEGLEYVWQMPGQDRRYVLTDNGRAYVVDNKLV